MLARRPTTAELEIARGFLREQSTQLAKDNRRLTEVALPDPLPDGCDPYSAAALSGLCLALFNLNEFIYID
jgi:hypothetical protein